MVCCQRTVFGLLYTIYKKKQPHTQPGGCVWGIPHCAEKELFLLFLLLAGAAVVAVPVVGGSFGFEVLRYLFQTLLAVEIVESHEDATKHGTNPSRQILERQLGSSRCLLGNGIGRSSRNRKLPPQGPAGPFEDEALRCLRLVGAIVPICVDDIGVVYPLQPQKIVAIFLCQENRFFLFGDLLKLPVAFVRLVECPDGLPPPVGGENIERVGFCELLQPPHFFRNALNSFGDGKVSPVTLYVEDERAVPLVNRPEDIYRTSTHFAGDEVGESEWVSVLRHIAKLVCRFSPFG